MNKVSFLPDVSHPLKGELKRHGISQLNASFCCGLSFQMLHKILNGYYKMPPEVEKILKKLIEDAKQVGM